MKTRLAFITLLLATFARGTDAAIAWVQLAENNLSGAVVSNAPFASPTTNGNSIICNIQYADNNTKSVLSVTDSAGNIYSGTGGKFYYSLEANSLETWYVGGIKGGSNVVITITFSASTTSNVSCHEFSGIIAVLDQQTAGKNDSGTSLTIGPVTTTVASELVFAGGYTGANTAGPGTGFTQVSSMNADIVEYKISGAPGSVTAAMTSGGTDDMSLKMATFSSWTGCYAPLGMAGQLMWNSSTGTMQFCDGTNWNEMTWTTGASCAGTKAGTIQYAAGTFQYCNGTNWLGMKGASAGSCSGTVAGTMIYNSGSSFYEFCDGTTWYSMKAKACQIVLTAGTSWTVTSDFNNNYNSVNVIAGGGGGAGSTTVVGGGGGGGGAFSAAANVALTPSSSVTYAIGSAGAAGASGGGVGGDGGNTYFCNSTSNCASIAGTAVLAGAVGGTGSTGTAAGAGGLNTGGFGGVTKSGGSGSANVATTKGGGGGGAGGPSGDGSAASGQTGGTGNNGLGGAGGPANTAGSAGSEWAATTGSGGGGGGANTAAGKAGGNYGAGGGGGGTSGTAKAGGAGKAGVIVIKYTGTTCT